MLRLFIASVLITCLSFAAVAQKKALVGGRLIDGYGYRPLDDSVILIDGDRIEAIGQVGTLAVSDEYEVISTEGMDVLPGLWESHAHLMLVGHSNYAHWQPTYADRFASEIMPAAAVQLLLAGVTAARDLGAPLDDSVEVLRRVEEGEIPGPRLFMSGPFLQHEAPPGTEKFRWGVKSVEEAYEKVDRIADAGLHIIKLIDHDEMEYEIAKAIVDRAHERGMKVVAHSHKPDEIRIGLKLGIDSFEHTGLTTAPEYPADIMEALKERTAKGRIAGGPLYWTPTVEGLYQFQNTVDNPEKLDDTCWHRGLKEDTIADIRGSLISVGHLGYTRLTPLRRPTLKRKIAQLREAGVVFLVGTDSGIPATFHCQSTWNEMAVLTDVMGIPAMEVIRAATYWPAFMMGVNEDMGSIRPGKYADIIAVRGDVLRYINLLQNVEFVMKGGTVYKEKGQPIESALN